MTGQDQIVLQLTEKSYGNNAEKRAVSIKIQDESTTGQTECVIYSELSAADQQKWDDFVTMIENNTP